MRNLLRPVACAVVVVVAVSTSTAATPSTAEPQQPDRHDQLLASPQDAVDDADLVEADRLYRASNNSADRQEALALMRQAFDRALKGLMAVLPRDPENELAVRFVRLLSDISQREQPPDDSGPTYVDLLAASESGRCDAAEKLGADLLRRAPQFVYGYILVGDCYFHNGDWKTAKSRYEQAAKADPAYARAFTRIAECQDELGSVSDALASYRHAVILNPGSDALVKSLQAYAYGHDYKVLLNRGVRRARIITTAAGDPKVMLTPLADVPDAVNAAWLAYGLKKLILYLEAANRTQNVEPAFSIEQQAFGAMLDVWESAQASQRALADEDLDFLKDLRRAGLLDAFVYVRYFQPEWSTSYSRWRSDHAAEIRTLFDRHLVVVDPIQTTFRDAVKLLGAGRYADALPLLERSAQGFIKSRDPEIKDLLARNLTLMGRAARILGRTDEALTFHTQARTLLHDLGAQKQEAIVINSLALTMVELGRPDEALALYEEALAIHRTRRDVAAEGDVLVNVGSFYLARGETEQARAALERALALTTGRTNAALFSNLGTVAAQLGNYKEAFDAYEKGLSAAVGAHDRLNEITLLSNLGELSINIGQLDKGRKYLEDGLSKARDLEDKESEAALLNNLGGASLAAGNVSEAFKYMSDSYALKKDIHAKSSEAASLLNLGGISGQMGDMPRAMAYFRDALDLARELKDRDAQAAALNNLASSGDDVTRQLAYFAEGLSLVSGADLHPTAEDPYPTPAHKDILSVRTAEPLLRNRGVLLLRLARKAAAGSSPDGSAGYLRGAVASLTRAIDLIEDVHRSTAPQGLEAERYRISYLAGKVSAYESLVSAQLALHAAEPGRGWEREAFATAERSKARTLLDLLGESKVKVFVGIPGDVLRQEKEFELRIGALQSEIAKHVDSPSREPLVRQLDVVTADFDAFKHRIRLSYPRYSDLKYPDPVTLDSVQRALNPRSAVIELFVGEDFIAEWLITANGTRSLVIVGAGTLLADADLYRRSIAGPRQKPAADAARRLYRALIAPLDDLLRDVSELVIIPDGPFSRLPFEALTGGENDTAGYLVERFAISYAPSSSVLTLLGNRGGDGKARKPLFAIGRPTYTAQAPPSRQTTRAAIDWAAKRGQTVTADLYPFYLGQATLSDLPGTEREVDRIGQILRSTDQVFKAAAATEQLVKDYSTRGRLRDFRFIHFATHGLVSDEIPALTSLALAVDKEHREDGFLTLGEVYGLELNSDLVTLSACDVGLGKLERGEGIVGLTRAFMYAGSAAVAVTLWRIADGPTATFMEAFYSNLARGDSAASALRQAQIQFIHGPQSHPYYWAPFVIHGRSNSSR